MQLFSPIIGAIIGGDVFAEWLQLMLQEFVTNKVADVVI